MRGRMNMLGESSCTIIIYIGRYIYAGACDTYNSTVMVTVVARPRHVSRPAGVRLCLDVTQNVMGFCY